MRALDRKFNRAESLLLLVLAVLLAALAYFRFVYIPISEEIERAHAERDALETELMGVELRLAQLTRMRRELDTIGTDGDRMESYNNSKAELSLLNSSLLSARQYSVSFNSVTRDGDQIRRDFSLQFTADDFDTAKSILASLSDSEYRCLLGDVSYAERADAERGGVTVSTTATFYETMVGGTPDAGLPQDHGPQQPPPA